MLALRQMHSDHKPFDASFDASDRYTRPTGDQAQTWVVVSDQACEGTILGRNGPRVQVRFVLDGSTYVRWFDADALLDEPPA